MTGLTTGLTKLTTGLTKLTTGLTKLTTGLTKWTANWAKLRVSWIELKPNPTMTSLPCSKPSMESLRRSLRKKMSNIWQGE
ncbi:hypothetical protein J4772_04035 [Cohnella sp. LGH]|nr:hypothetical protein J4772_04035 [Cohnella sp. LGH]